VIKLGQGWLKLCISGKQFQDSNHCRSHLMMVCEKIKCAKLVLMNITTKKMYIKWCNHNYNHGFCDEKNHYLVSK
jgi:hypothetical protein